MRIKSSAVRAFSGCNSLISIRIKDCTLIDIEHRMACINSLVEDNADPESNRGRNHIKYLKANMAKKAGYILSHPSILCYICEHKLMTAKNYLVFEETLARIDNVELKALLLDYRNDMLYEKRF